MLVAPRRRGRRAAARRRAWLTRHLLGDVGQIGSQPVVLGHHHGQAIVLLLLKVVLRVDAALVQDAVWKQQVGRRRAVDGLGARLAARGWQRTSARRARCEEAATRCI